MFPTTKDVWPTKDLQDQHAIEANNKQCGSYLIQQCQIVVNDTVPYGQKTEHNVKNSNHFLVLLKDKREEEEEV